MEGKIKFVGGPVDGVEQTVNNPKVCCYPIFGQVPNIGMAWVTAVYKPDEESNTAIYDRTIQFGDDQYVTPIDQSLFEELLSVEDTLLELGSGTTTWWLHKHRDGRHTLSIEDNGNYYGLFGPFTTQIYAPLSVPADNPEQWSFYDPNIVGRLLTGVQYGALLVDGPDSDNRMKGFKECVNLFNPNVPWYIDDLVIYEDAIKDLAEHTGRKLELHTDCKKHWAKLLPKGPYNPVYQPRPIRDKQ